MIPEFGQVYRIPKLKNNNPVGGHWVVLLYADKNTNKVYYQTLGSRMFKIFPNFGSFKNEHCYNCSTHRHLKEFLKYKSSSRLNLDTDSVEFLNYRKYGYLTKETFLSMKNVVPDNYFDFESKVDKGIYKCCGSLLDRNKKGALLAARHSSGLSLADTNGIFDFYKNGMGV